MTKTFPEGRVRDVSANVCRTLHSEPPLCITAGPAYYPGPYNFRWYVLYMKGQLQHAGYKWKRINKMCLLFQTPCPTNQTEWEKRRDWKSDSCERMEQAIQSYIENTSLDVLQLTRLRYYSLLLKSFCSQQPAHPLCLWGKPQGRERLTRPGASGCFQSTSRTRQLLWVLGKEKDNSQSSSETHQKAQVLNGFW